LLRPAGGNQDELEAVGNALQAILDRDACHRLKEPPQATTNGNPARRESLDLPRGGRYEPPAHGAPVAPARDRGRRARPARGPEPAAGLRGAHHAQRPAIDRLTGGNGRRLPGGTLLTAADCISARSQAEALPAPRLAREVPRRHAASPGWPPAQRGTRPRRPSG